jgi:AmmeMemoRadiSam system protein A
MSDELNQTEREILLRAARNAIEKAVLGIFDLDVNKERIPESLNEHGATFVTLTKNGLLRGCIGALNPTKPLIDDVCEHAVAAAMDDFRFPPLGPDEVDQIRIEISRISPPLEINFANIDELLSEIQPGVDGIIIRDGNARATFLPQVWTKIPDKEKFLSYLCKKMGAPADLWKKKKIEVLKYQVEEFSEE